MSSIRRGPPPTLSTGSVRPRSPAEALEPGRAPSRPRARREHKSSRAVGGMVRVVSGVLTLVLLTMAATGGMIFLLHHLYERPGPLEVSRVVAIPKGEGRIEIAERLEQEGVITNRWVFIANHLIQSWYGDKGLDLKAGEYEIAKNASMREVLEELVEGKSVLYKVTIPEGLTSQQIVTRLNDDPNLTGEIAAVPPEGTLLPDTYRFSKGTDRNELIARMQSEQVRFIDSIWEKRQQGLPVDNKERVIILASIIEKETGRADERERVAGVFVNRLKKRMRLQSDPTVIYGLVGGQASLGRPITRADLDQKNDYNTYQIDALPPGPICNPGRGAIEAALKPAATNDLYFVADGTGGHVFSDTLKEHNEAVAEWRKYEKDMRARQERQAKAEAADGDSGADAIPNPPAEAGTAAAPAAVPAANMQASTLPLPVRKPKR